MAALERCLDDKSTLTGAFDPGKNLYNILERCQTDTKRIISAAKKVINYLRNIDRGGPDSKDDLKVYISDLSYIFEDLMQKKATVTFSNVDEEMPYSGRFFHFVETCLGIIDPEKTFNNSHLGSLIQKVIKRRASPKTRA